MIVRSDNDEMDILVERTIGKLALEVAHLKEDLLARNALEDTVLSAVKRESRERGLELEKLKEDHAALTQWALDQGCEPLQVIKDYKLKPNAREIAMAKTKGEFTQAVVRYATRTGLSDGQAKERLKAVLGLGATTKK